MPGIKQHVLALINSMDRINSQHMIKLFIMVFSIALFSSCEKDSFFLWDHHSIGESDKAYIYAPSPVIDVKAPSSVKFGEPIRMQLHSLGNSGCAGFSRFDVSYTGRNTINIRVEQKEPREDFCTSVLTTLTSIYEFIPDARQQYTFNFWRGKLYENDFITVQVTVR
jgi:hypothetical protein